MRIHIYKYKYMLCEKTKIVLTIGDSNGGHKFVNRKMVAQKYTDFWNYQNLIISKIRIIFLLMYGNDIRSKFGGGLRYGHFP